ncbi:MAG: hypothetical protein F6J98_25345 [Moorea sp. SIO4G2]|nr:hypothetical protein [Moorena sp. SIO4G2]
MGRWGDGVMGRWGDGVMGRWGDGVMGREQEQGTRILTIDLGLLLSKKVSRVC